MKRIFPIILIVITSCYGSRSVNHVAKKKGLTVKQAGGINLLGGRLEIKERATGKESPVYLFYSGDTLQYLSMEKQVTNGDFIYRIHHPGDSVYMLTRQSQFRYFYEDTVLFHKDYVVSNRVSYGVSPMNKREIVNASFYSYHVTRDSILEFYNHSTAPIVSIHQYGTAFNPTQQFISNHATRRAYPRPGTEEFIRQVIH